MTITTKYALLGPLMLVFALALMAAMRPRVADPDSCSMTVESDLIGGVITYKFSCEAGSCTGLCAPFTWTANGLIHAICTCDGAVDPDQDCLAEVWGLGTGQVAWECRTLMCWFACEELPPGVYAPGTPLCECP